MTIITIRFAFLRTMLVLFPLVLIGCYPTPKVPIDTFRYDAPHSDHRLLFVFLPGKGDSPREFEKEGLLRALRERGLPADVIVVNAHLGYYMEGSIFLRLKQDVIAPARARGYRNIWLVGNSLGGYGSISYVRLHPRDISGVILLGPFLGEKTVIREITESGGLREWKPGDLPVDAREAWDRELWKWIQDEDQQKCFWDWVRNCDEGHDGCPSRIYLGYGKGDRFSPGQILMAQTLPPAHVFQIDGGHNWRTWKKVWPLILDRIVKETPVICTNNSPGRPSLPPSP